MSLPAHILPLGGFMCTYTVYCTAAIMILLYESKSNKRCALLSHQLFWVKCSHCPVKKKRAWRGCDDYTAGGPIMRSSSKRLTPADTWMCVCSWRAALDMVEKGDQKIQKPQRGAHDYCLPPTTIQYNAARVRRISLQSISLSPNPSQSLCLFRSPPSPSSWCF